MSKKNSIYLYRLKTLHSKYNLAIEAESQGEAERKLMFYIINNNLPLKSIDYVNTVDLKYSELNKYTMI
ncbi:MAG: hypothetical protein ACI4XM_09000 [Candidatus Coprovivens sp.]